MSSPYAKASGDTLRRVFGWRATRSLGVGWRKVKESNPRPGGRPGFQDQLRATTRKFSSSNGMSALGDCWCSVAGTRPLRRASSDFRSPASPDTGSRWPTFYLTEPMGNGCARF